MGMSGVWCFGGYDSVDEMGINVDNGANKR